MTRKARIAALLGDDLGVREVYRIHRGTPDPATLPRPGGKLVAIPAAPVCWRCGAVVSHHGSGVWAPLTVLSRIRGTLARGIQVHRVHLGCVPSELAAPLGLPARKVGRGRR
jgi:hypothetical protein